MAGGGIISFTQSPLASNKQTFLGDIKINNDPSWWYEKPGTYKVINSATWTDCTPEDNLGASIVCNKDFIYTFATSTTEADTNFDAGNIFYWGASTRREIKVYQGRSDYKLYVKCDDDDEITGGLAKNPVAAVVNTAGTPNRVTIQTNAAHGFTAGEFVTIAGTINYNGTFKILDVPAADTLTIYHSYTAESPVITATFDVYPAIESAIINQ